MKTFKITFTSALLIGSFQSLGQTSRPLTTETSDGGPVLTNNAYGDIDKDSTLHRIWHTVNDATCPAQLVRAGVKTVQVFGTANFEYKPVVESFTAKEPITAMEMRFALYDVFNEHIVTLEITRVEDVASPGSFMFKRVFKTTKGRYQALLLAAPLETIGPLRKRLQTKRPRTCLTSMPIPTTWSVY